MTALGIILSALAALLAGGLLAIAAWIAYRRARMMGAQEKLLLAPPALLREQDDVICTVIDQLQVFATPELKDRMITAHDHYMQIMRGYENMRKGIK